MAIVINSTTGEIDLDATTPDTYVVTYTVGGVSSTQDVTVNALDNAAFSYSASSYEPTDADPTPTITGLTGGTFSGTTGLVINSTTGEIDLSASTVASHTITYNTSTSGSSVCPNTSTFGVTIALAGLSNVYSMAYDGANDYIETTAHPMDFTTGDFTCSAWVNVANVSNHQGIFGIRDGSGTSLQFYIRNNNKLGSYNGSNDVFSTSTITNSVWNHVVLIQRGGNKEFYINGNLDTTLVQANGSSSTATFKIGYTGYGGEYLNGSIDEVGIWNTALTSSQVAQIYNATSTGKTSDLSTISGSNLKYWNRMGD